MEGWACEHLEQLAEDLNISSNELKTEYLKQRAKDSTPGAIRWRLNIRNNKKTTLNTWSNEINIKHLEPWTEDSEHQESWVKD